MSGLKRAASWCGLTHSFILITSSVNAWDDRLDSDDRHGFLSAVYLVILTSCLVPMFFLADCAVYVVLENLLPVKTES